MCLSSSLSLCASPPVVHFPLAHTRAPCKSANPLSLFVALVPTFSSKIANPRALSLCVSLAYHSLSLVLTLILSHRPTDPHHHHHHHHRTKPLSDPHPKVNLFISDRPPSWHVLKPSPFPPDRQQGNRQRTYHYPQARFYCGKGDQGRRRWAGVEGERERK